MFLLYINFHVFGGTIDGCTICADFEATAAVHVDPDFHGMGVV